MKQFKEKTKSNVTPLSNDELQNTFGGAYWEIRIKDGTITWIFHPYGDPPTS